MKIEYSTSSKLKVIHTTNQAIAKETTPMLLDVFLELSQLEEKIACTIALNNTESENSKHRIKR